MKTNVNEKTSLETDWSNDVYAAIRAAGIQQIATVPDGGLVPLLRHCESDPDINVVTLTSEEEGIAFSSGAWLGGHKAAMLMQSSGVGNCINMLSLPQTCRLPMLMLITMRGEWGEFNPWQVPMGQAVRDVLEAMQVRCYRPGVAAEIGEAFAAAAHFVFSTGSSAAVIVSQRIVGAKTFS